jgi:uncharacterized cupin superfamily protein
MKVQHTDTEANDFESPKGHFGITYRDHISCEDTGCPFDLQHVTLKPGKKNFPFHTHGSLWELYYAVSGTATMRTDEETVDFQAGDSYLCRPGLAHQIINDSTADFVYLVISNDPPHDSCYTPTAANWLQVQRNYGGPCPKARDSGSRSKVWSTSPEKSRRHREYDGFNH